MIKNTVQETTVPYRVGYRSNKEDLIVNFVPFIEFVVPGKEMHVPKTENC